MKGLKSDLSLFTLGGCAYGAIELLWRHRTHWTMLITGGACFVALFKLYKKHPNLPTLEKCVLGSGVITVIELAVGCVVNLWLKMNVWDYSTVPFNFMGQICVLYSMLWGILCIPINKICKAILKAQKKAEIKGVAP